MSSDTQVSHKIQIQATAADWAQLRDARARAAAASNYVDSLQSALGLPDAKALAQLVGASAESDAQTVLVVDGNGSPLGTLTVFWHPGGMRKAGFQRRINA